VFVTAALALHIYQKKLDFLTLCLNILQPARMDSGPVALNNAPLGRLCVKRLRVYGSWMALGIFFYTVLATGLAPFLVLRDSTESVDILVFSIVFEFYVYFNNGKPRMDNISSQKGIKLGVQPLPMRSSSCPEGVVV
jgi:hypothetical protein